MIRVGVLTVAAFCALAAPAPAAPGARRGPTAGMTGMRPSNTGGFHMRLGTPHGPIHLYRPAGYNRRTAGIVVYVHGYYVHVDDAWRDHKLEAQFAASHRNALFITPEAPATVDEALSWPSLRRLIAFALRRGGLRAPSGPLVVIGHSGAYRSIVSWLDEASLHNLILIDGLYGNEPEFNHWLEKNRANQMTLVVKGTAKWADPFVRALPYAVTVPEIPARIEQLSAAQRAAKVLCLRSQYGHFELITEGQVLPVMVARTPLPALRQSRRRRP